MAPKKKGLTRTAAVLAAIALLEKAIQKAAEDPRVRRKAKALAMAAAKRVRAAAKKIGRVARSVSKRASRAKRRTTKRVRQRSRS